MRPQLLAIAVVALLAVGAAVLVAISSQGSGSIGDQRNQTILKARVTIEPRVRVYLNGKLVYERVDPPTYNLYAMLAGILLGTDYTTYLSSGATSGSFYNGGGPKVFLLSTPAPPPDEVFNSTVVPVAVLEAGKIASSVYQVSADVYEVALTFFVTTSSAADISSVQLAGVYSSTSAHPNDKVLFAWDNLTLHLQPNDNLTITYLIDFSVQTSGGTALGGDFSTALLDSINGKPPWYKNRNFNFYTSTGTKISTVTNPPVFKRIVRYGACTKFIISNALQVPPSTATIKYDTDEAGSITMTWEGSIPISGSAQPYVVTFVLETPGCT